jgi:hypothetical protein
MAKLTLSVDEGVVERAKQFAANNGTSVSRLVEQYLDSVSRPVDLSSLPPHLRSLVGIVKAPPDFDARKEYRDYLAKKYL